LYCEDGNKLKVPVSQLMDELDECRKPSWIKREEELIIEEFFLVQQ